MEEILRSVSLRPAISDDESFLLNLYASTRSNELDLLNWDDKQKQAFIDMQFSAQRQQHLICYPQADSSIILLNDDAVGRLLVNRRERELALVDISLLPAHQRLGIGTHLMRELLKEAAAAAKPVRLHVLQSNPARNLYERLGFSIVSGDSIYCEMLWVPTDKI